ncbi:MAG: hypothetical protein A2173_08900 [Planctomycetes bacterium RBG_13_44_8b]|nr:MAG: hypothetical protein A2173_08900 [Planctomycetes bacterium RBG_13_44_8b]
MYWTPLKFGKHKGKTLPQVMFSDPDWFFHIWDEGGFDENSNYHNQAKVIYAKATSICIPQNKQEMRKVEYNLLDGKSVGFDLVPVSRPQHRGATQTILSDHIDMSFPHSVRKYDKLGYKLFLRSLKFYFFGNKSLRMTRKHCEEFFNDETNFHNND